MTYAVHYDEGPKVGYKWYEVEKKQPLFAFGFGLSYTTFEYSGLSVDSAAKTVRLAVKNTGKRAGAEIVEVYAKLPEDADESFKRLVGWKRFLLSPGESQTITVAIDERPLQIFDEANNRWIFATGDYQILVGASSDNLSLTGGLSVH